ncbi:MAG: hypothetical protein RSH24_15405 [Flavobacterium sp.]
MTKILRWKEFPLCQPTQSGWYMINCKVNNIYITAMSFFDSTTNSWYEGSSKEKNLSGVGAFNPKLISA